MLEYIQDSFAPLQDENAVVESHIIEFAAMAQNCIYLGRYIFPQ